MIYALACRLNGNGDADTTHPIIIGFTGHLQDWWDHYITPSPKMAIQTATRVKQEDPNSVAETQFHVVKTLVYTILLHFIGSTRIQFDRSQEQLLNLKCPTLSLYKGYKNVFLSKVLSREDCNNDFWKEKFLPGFRPLFDERVRTRLRLKHNGNIPHSHYTYGELAAKVVAEGLALCNDIKIKKQLEKDHLIGK